MLAMDRRKATEWFAVLLILTEYSGKAECKMFHSPDSVVNFSGTIRSINHWVKILFKWQSRKEKL